MVRRLAICLAHHLLRELKILSRYKKLREQAEKPAEKDIVLNNVGHGVFAEALFKKAGVIVTERERQEGVSFNSEQVGGYLNPLESFSLQIDNPDEIPDLIPVKINRNNGSSVSEIFLSREKLEILDRDYDDWKKQGEKE